MKQIDKRVTPVRTTTTYKGSLRDFENLAKKHNLTIEDQLNNGTVYATDKDGKIDLAYRPHKDNHIRLTIWKDLV